MPNNKVKQTAFRIPESILKDMTEIAVNECWSLNLCVIEACKDFIKKKQAQNKAQ